MTATDYSRQYRLVLLHVAVQVSVHLTNNDEFPPCSLGPAPALLLIAI